MEKITTHSPLQTRKESSQKHERMLSLLTAESINTLSESLTGEKRTRVDVWNTFHKSQDKEYENDTERERDITKLIDARYGGQWGQGQWGQEPFLGLPGFRNVLTKLNFVVILSTHLSPPKGFPLFTL